MTETYVRPIDEMASYADEYSPAGLDGFKPSVDRFVDSFGVGFYASYDDDVSGTLVAIRYLSNGFTSTKVQVLNESLEAAEVARVASLVKIAAGFAEQLERRARIRP